MYLQLAEPDPDDLLMGRRSKSERKSHRKEMNRKRLEKMKKAFYVPIRRGSKIFHVREDLLDNMSEDDFEITLEEAESIEEYLNEGEEYLGDKASRQAKKQARRERREQRKAMKDEKMNLKNERKRAKNDVISARAEAKRGRAEAKKIKAETGGGGNWLDDVKGVAGAVGDVVGAVTGRGGGSEAVQDPETGELYAGDTGSRIGTAVGKKPKTGLYIGIGAGVLVLVGAILLLSKKRK